MNYADFRQRVVDTFNRMHIVAVCDDGFIEAGAENDVGMILMKSMMGMFHIERIEGMGYAVSATTLTRLFINDEDNFLEEALNSYNLIMDKFNVVFNSNVQYEGAHLHII